MNVCAKENNMFLALKRGGGGEAEINEMVKSLMGMIVRCYVRFLI